MAGVGSYNKVYRPTLQRGATALALHQPLVATQKEYTNRMRITRVPLRDGFIISSVTKDGCRIALDGIMYAATRALLVAAEQTLTNFLIENTAAFSFYRYYDTSNGYYRWFPNCACENLNFTYDPRSVFQQAYAMTIVAPGGREYESGSFPAIGGGVGGDLGADPLPDLDIEIDGSTINELAHESFH